MSSEFGQDMGLIHEAVITGRKLGAGMKFWAALAHHEWLFKKVTDLVAEEMRLTFCLAPTIERNLTGWECKDPVKAEGEFTVEFIGFLQKDEQYLDVPKMIMRATEKGVASGLRHLEAILREQDKIPVEMRRFCLVSTEVWLKPGGGQYLWCLYQKNNHWILGDKWLGDCFNSCFRLITPLKYQKQS